MTTQRQQALAIVGAILAALAWGASGVIAKVLDMDGLAIVTYRFALAALVFMFVMPVFGQGLTVRKLMISAPAGTALAADTALFFSAVKETTLANATVIGALQPVLMLILAHRFLGERITPRQVFWSFVAIGGAVFLIVGSTEVSGWSLRGDLLAAGALIMWTAYFFLNKLTQSKGEITPMEFTTAVALFTAVLVTPVGFAFGQNMSWPTTESWVLLAAMAFGSGMLAHLVMNWSLVHIPISLGSAFTLLVPVGATVGAWLFVDEVIGFRQIVSIAITLIALGALAQEHRA